MSESFSAMPLTVRTAIIVLQALAVLPVRAAGASERTTAPIDVIRYTATVAPEIESKSISGRVTIVFLVVADAVTDVAFDCGDLTIDAVADRTQKIPFDQRDRHLYVHMSRAAHRGQRRQLTVDYHGAPQRGIQFDSAASRVTTVFSTSEWLVCIDAPADKAALELTIIVPRDLHALGNGRLVTEHDMANGRRSFTWRQDHPVSTYIFGFAAGRFAETDQIYGSIRLRYLGDAFSAQELETIFRDTEKTLRFFEDRAGVRYRDPSYSQLLAGTGIGQEMSSFSLLPEGYGRSVLVSGDTGGLGAHELAHQWWGNLVTCASWNEFWLNEGLATFMVAASFEEFSGRPAYLKQIEVSRGRYERVKEAGHDRPLVFPNWNHPTADDRTLVYHKGAYFVHVLREEIGDKAFWSGLRQYTIDHAGGSVTSADFQASMEGASGRDLSRLFSEWVYPSPH